VVLLSTFSVPSSITNAYYLRFDDKGIIVAIKCSIETTCVVKGERFTFDVCLGLAERCVTPLLIHETRVVLKGNFTTLQNQCRVWSFLYEILIVNSQVFLLVVTYKNIRRLKSRRDDESNFNGKSYPSRVKSYFCAYKVLFTLYEIYSLNRNQWNFIDFSDITHNYINQWNMHCLSVIIHANFDQWKYPLLIKIAERQWILINNHSYSTVNQWITHWFRFREI